MYAYICAKERRTVFFMASHTQYLVLRSVSYGKKRTHKQKKKRANKKRQMCAHARAHTHTRQRSNSGVDRRNTTCGLWYTRAMDDSLPTADVMYCCSGRTQIVPVLIEKRGIILSAIRDTSKFLPVCPARDGEITEIYTSFGVCG